MSLPVAELESPSSGPGPVPFLALAIAMLLMTALTVLLTGAAEDTEAEPEARLAAAASAAEDVDFAFTATVTMGDSAESLITLEGTYDADSQRLHAFVEALDNDAELIQDGPVGYFRFAEGNPLAAAAGAKPWSRIDRTGEPGADFAAPNVEENPLDTLARLGEIRSPIERVGEADVRGVPTVHFRTTIDGSARARPGTNDAQLASLRNIQIDVWLDDRDRPRRHRATTTVAGVRQLATIEIYDFGKAVSIELPPADQVGEFDLDAMRRESQVRLDELTKRPPEE